MYACNQLRLTPNLTPAAPAGLALHTLEVPLSLCLDLVPHCAALADLHVTRCDAIGHLWDYLALCARLRKLEFDFTFEVPGDCRLSQVRSLCVFDNGLEALRDLCPDLTELDVPSWDEGELYPDARRRAAFDLWPNLVRCRDGHTIVSRNLAGGLTKHLPGQTLRLDSI